MVGWIFHIFLAFFVSFCCCNGQRFIIVAPNLMRTDAQENIFLQANGVKGSIPVTIYIRDFNENRDLFHGSTTLSEQNNYHTLTSVQVPSFDLNPNEKVHKYVVLEVQFGGDHTERRVIMVSFQSGYIFIMTDKPIYKPMDTVRFRAFVSSSTFKASDAKTITVDIKNPDGVVVSQELNKKVVGGFYPGSYSLPEMVKEGKWTIIARFDHWPENNFNTTFEVKKYVLPPFKVTLNSKPYLDKDDRELKVTITARYLFNEPVIGTAYVIYGIKRGHIRMRSPIAKRVEMEGQGGILTLTMDEIKQACAVKSNRTESNCSITSLVGSFVYVKVSVLTESGGDLVEAEKNNIKIVSSPYVLTIKDFTKYFKPGLPFHFTIHVTHHDGSPANNVPLKINLLNNEQESNAQGTAGVSINMPNELKAKTIIVSTKHKDVERQAKVEVVVKPYSPLNPSRPSYLYIHAGRNKVQMGYLSLDLSIESANKNDLEEFTYLVLSKGKILEANRTSIGSVISITLKVTPEMIPSFRLVAFYLIGTEVVSDSIKLTVSQSCVNTPEVILPSREFRPKADLRLEIKGEPLSRISLVAVDQAVYLLSKNRFDQRFILDEVESRDMGCTHGSGSNAMGVFTDAGLSFTLNRGSSTETRRELTCPDNARRRRSADEINQQVQLVEEFEGKLLQRCCRDGLRGVAMPYTCEQRSLYITEGPECVRAFVKCCNIYKKRVISRKDELQLGRGTETATGASSDIADGEDNDALLKLAEEIQLRSDDKFYEAWLWRDVVLPEKTDHNGLASITVNEGLPDSITEWAIHAVSSSKKTGFCVIEPQTFVAKQNFFIDLRVPYSVVRNEQVEIKAVVYNYMNVDLDLTVVLMKTTDICSVAFKRQHTQRIRVRSGKSVVVPYTIMPLKAGKKPIEVAAFVVNLAQDRIRRTLNVVVEGVQKTAIERTSLNPTDHKGEQVFQLNKTALRGVVPFSEPKTTIIFTGNVLAESIQNSIQDDPLASLIKMPGGCVEQNLASMTFPIIANVYLDKTNSWESVGVQRKIDAKNYIMQGYKKQLNYQRGDGSYPPHSGKDGSTWVTAYTAKVFTMAYILFQDQIDVDNICKPLKFVLEKRQNPDGSFQDPYPLCHPEMTGGVIGSDSTETLTAFVMTALAEVQQANIDCSYLIVDTQSAINKTAPYLKRALQRNLRPYTKAITSYALALLKEDIHFDPTDKLLQASSDGTFWPDSDSMFRLEATGYALLALVKMGRLREAKKPFDFLSSNRGIGGSYGNTQSTMVVLHALSEYLIKQPARVEETLNVNLRIKAGPRQLRSESLNFNHQTSYQSRLFNDPKNADFREVVATGNGKGTVEIITYYNQLPEEDHKSCKAFNLQVSIQKSDSSGGISAFVLTITVKALGPNPARSVILDISLPTGFTPETSDLENLLNSVDRYIDYFYFDEKLSERSSLIVHLDEVSNEEDQKLSFRLNQQFRVGLLQPSPVTVYEYYKDKEQYCTRMYSPPQDHKELSKICQNTVCTCTQDDCCNIKDDPDDIEDKEREAFACKSLRHVFQVKVLNVTGDNHKYEVEITKLIKDGIEQGVRAGQRRFFYSHTRCKHQCQLQLDSLYLIMGPETDRWTIDPKTDKYLYVLGKDTWVEPWPTNCSDPAVEDHCNALAEVERYFSEEGCRLKK